MTDSQIRAFSFLCSKWHWISDRLDRGRPQFVSMLTEFMQIHGEAAVEKLAGFCIYAAQQSLDDFPKYEKMITQTLAHDLFDRAEPCMLPRSDSYLEYWKVFHDSMNTTDQMMIDEYKKSQQT